MLRNKITYILIAFVSILIISVAGNTYSGILKEKSIKAVHNELVSIATLKIDNISGWYTDELEDAHIISQNSFLNNQIQQWHLTRSNIDSMQMEEKIQSIKREHGYEDIWILITENGLLGQRTGPNKTIPHQVQKTAELALKSNSVLSTDLYYDENDGEVYLDFISPLNDKNKNIIGIIIFRMSPNQFLFPLIQNWPVPSETAETAIFRKSNDSITYLNELRHAQHTALKLSISLNRTDVSAVQGALGFDGIVDGLDYRDMEVISYVSDIHDTPWFIVAEVDKAELYEGITDQTRFFNLLLVLLLFLVLTLLGFIYSNSQKNIFKTLWLAQEEFKTTLYSIGDAVITTDKQGIITHLNPIAEQLTGWKEEEALGLPIEEVFHIISEVTSQKVESPVAKVMREGKIVGLANHTLLVSKNGDQTPIADSGAPILDDQKNISGIVLVFRDQSQEREHQKLVEEQHRRLFTLMSNLPGMAYRCYTDQFWTMEFVSKGCFQLLGYHDYELEQNKKIAFGDLIIPEDRIYVNREVERALQHNSSFEIEYRIKDRSGLLKWVWEKGQGVINETGEIIAIEGFIRDITILKKNQTDLAKSEHLFHTLAKNAGVGIFKTNEKGLTIYVNPKYCELVGLTAEEALGLGWLKFLHPDDRKTIEGNWSNALTDQSERIDEYRFVHPNGKIVWVKGQVSPETGNNGELLGFIGTITDITDKRRTQEELVAAMLKAEESDRLKTSFLANMSHEIRTPLNSILGFTNILEESDGLTPKERSDYSTIIRKSSESLLQIINDIIDISSLETGQMKIFNSKFDINHLINMLHQEFIHRAVELGKNEIAIRKTDIDDTIFITSDKNRINQIFINLLTNAMKFTDKGTIEFGIVDHDENNIYFKVHDTGFGIAEDMRNVIFERFRQGEEKNTRNFGGNGLGLSIVKNLIELMGGKIWLDSEVGIGSCFNFYLPKSI